MKRLTAFYISLFLLFSAVYVLLFHSPLFSGQKVLFYRGLFLLIVALLLVSFLLFTVRSKLHIRLESIIAGLMLCVSIHLMLFVVFPVTFDRSVTMFLLENINDNKNPLSSCSGMGDVNLKKRFIESYVHKKDAIGRRISEQTVIGFVNGSADCRTLSPGAKAFLQFSDTVSRIYGL